MKKLPILALLLFAAHTYGMHRAVCSLARQAVKLKLQQRWHTTNPKKQLSAFEKE